MNSVMVEANPDQSAFEVSEDLIDEDWDAFLQTTPLGQFQQSSMWARAKSVEGWKPLRVKLRKDGMVLGGFQLLYKRSRIGRIGYVSKGPVVAGGDGDLSRRCVMEVKRQAARLRLIGVIVQFPDLAEGSEESLPELGFVPERLRSVITASLWFDLGCLGEELLRQIPTAETRRRIRQAQRKGVTLRVGGPDDLPLFFSLMVETCRRQGVRPNPSSLDALAALYTPFNKAGLGQILIASVDQTPLAALLCLACGDRMTIWKKGWNSLRSDCNPNHFLYYACLERGTNGRARFCDFASLAPGIASNLIRGIPLDPDQLKSRDAFHLSFGGRPVQLPGAWAWFQNPVVRWSYGVVATGRSWLKDR